MTFTAGIPADGQTLGSSKPQVRGNFANYNTVLSQDHVAPNSTGQGKHKQCTFPVQAQSPGTLTGEAAIYTKTVGAASQLFIQAQNLAAAGADIQMTRLDKGVSAANSGYSFLPGGVIMQWGITGPISAGQSPSYPIAFSNVYSVVVTPLSNSMKDVSFSINSVTTTQFTLQCDTNLSGLYWVAIGN